MGASIVSSDAETHTAPFSSNGNGEEKQKPSHTDASSVYLCAVLRNMQF